jgi:hypothetical protein
MGAPIMEHLMNLLEDELRPRTRHLGSMRVTNLINGRGILYLYHALFTALSKQSQSSQENHYHSNGNLNTETEPPNLTKPYDEWLSVSAPDAETLFQRVLVQGKPIALPGVDFARAPRKAVHRDLALSEESTAAVVEACKRKGYLS